MKHLTSGLDERYVEITRKKIAQAKNEGYVRRESIRRPKRGYSKKELQLELRDLTVRLGRLPTLEDVERMSSYKTQAFLDTFPTWGVALKAAKIEAQF